MLRRLRSIAPWQEVVSSCFLSLPSHEDELFSPSTLLTGKAAKKEEEGVNEAKQTFKREQDAMRAEVDQQLHSINNLYQEHCKDYAQMVSDECEGEISKASAGK